ncbi:hypothetical protein Sjap_013111 [Stephania japonica]|uniref:Telomerase reverse transcriptase n=1 Tax=Stephania japonica TaxID=461633 RepID=A0AAP0IXE5_9MAGN
MHGLATTCIPWLSRIHTSYCLRRHEPGKGLLKGCTMCSESQAALRNRLFSCWIYWLFSHLVVPIVQANFYVTESEVGKLETFYYRRNIWERITSRAISCLRKQNYHLLDDKLLRKILRKGSFGYSKVRFCPKEHGVRPLAILSAPSKISEQNHLTYQSSASKNRFRRVQRKEMFSCIKPVNYVLRDLNSVLKGIKMKHTDMLGSFVSDYNDVYKNLLPFIVNLKNRSVIFPSVYMVVSDVSKAFDSVDQDQLLSVIKEIMVDDVYHVKQLLQVVCTKKSLWTRRSETSLDKNISTSFPFHSLHGILVNQERSKRIRKEELYHNLYDHVKHNVLRVGQNFYLQEGGIPQGSVISPLLCSFYYGHLERKVIFPFLEKVDNNHLLEPSRGDLSGNICNADAIKNGVKDDCSKLHFHTLLRFVDDYLFMSTSKKHASSLFLRLQRGFRGYNFSISKAKSCVNFDIDNVPAISLKKMYTGEDGISFIPWSGLLINSRTLEIQADYTRYLGIHISSTLTVHWHQKPGRHLKTKLCDYLRPKCHPIFYDSNINSVAVVRLNIYQSFMLCAMKFHCYVCDMLSSCKFDAEFYFKMILYSLRYMHKLIKKRMHSLNTELEIRPLLELKKKEVEWLGLKAYIRILKIKQSRHSELISLLKSELFKHGMVASASLKYAVDESHSSMFWKMKF